MYSASCVNSLWYLNLSRAAVLSHLRRSARRVDPRYLALCDLAQDLPLAGLRALSAARALRPARALRTVRAAATLARVAQAGRPT